VGDSNGMVINLHKTKEIVLHGPHPRRWSLPKSLEGIEQVQSAKLLGVIFQVPSASLIMLINVKNFRGSLTTVVRAQNDTSKTANNH